jgi:hypothetical protein
MATGPQSSRSPSLIATSDPEPIELEGYDLPNHTDETEDGNNTYVSTTPQAELSDHGIFEENKSPDELYATVKQLRVWLPKCDPEDEQAKTWSLKRRQRVGLLWTSFLIAFVICIFNLVVLCVLNFRTSYERSDGLVSLFEGSCNKSRQLSVSYHVIINILSSGLLAASNLCMQLSTAPTRAQVDEAHQKENDYYDIGILSIRNWWKAKLSNKIICALLIISSLPLHFVFVKFVLNY